MNDTYLSDLRLVSDSKYKNVPELNYVHECVKNNLLIQNYINKKKRRVEFINEFRVKNDEDKFNTIKLWVSTIEKDEKLVHNEFLGWMYFKGNNFLIFDDSHLAVASKLKSLTITDCKLDLNSINKIFKKMREGKMILKNLSLAKNNLTSNDIMQLIKSILIFENLHTLDLSSNDMSVIELEPFEQFFSYK